MLEADATAPSTGPKRGMARNFGTATIVTAIGAIAGFTSAIVVSRLYGASVVGQFGMLLLPWVVVSRLSTWGEGAVLARESVGAEWRSERLSALVGAIAAFSFLLTAVVSILVLISSALIYTHFLDRPELIVPLAVLLAAYTLFANASYLVDCVSMGTGHLQHAYVGRLVAAVSNPVMTLAAGAWTRSIWGPVLGMTLSLALGFVPRAFVLSRYIDIVHLRSSSRNQLRELPRIIRSGLPMTFDFLAAGLFAGLPTWLLGAHFTDEIVGVYSRSTSIFSRVDELIGRFGEVVLPRLVIASKGERAENARIVRLIVLVSVIPFMFGAVLLAAFGREFLAIFGTEFQAGYSIVVLMGVSYLFQTAVFLVIITMHARDRLMSVVRIDLILLAVLIGILLAVVDHGPVAVAWLLCIGSFVRAVVLIYSCLAMIDDRTSAARTVVDFLCLVAPALVGVAVAFHFRRSGSPDLLSSSGVAALALSITAAMLLALLTLRPQLRRLLVSTLRRRGELA